MRLKFGVRQQIFAICALPLLFLVAIFVISLLMQTIPQNYLAISQHDAEVQLQTDRASQLITSANTAAAAYERTRRAQELRRFDAVETSAQRQFATLLATAGTDQTERAALRRYTTDIAAVFPIIRRYIDFIRAGDTRGAQRYAQRPELQRLGTEIVAARAAIYVAELNAARERSRTIRDEQTRLNQLTLALVVSGIVASLLLAGFFGLRTVRRLRRLAENAAHLGAREPTRALPGDDEIADVDRATHELARKLDESLALQLALTPADFPDVRGLHFSSVYVPAASDAHVGGDWLDVFEIDENYLGISVGDVAGHGLRAASTMTSLREAIRIAARGDRLPSKALRRVNQSFCIDRRGELATTSLAIFDGRSGTLQWATAGHPPPLLLRPDGSLESLEGHGLLFGIDGNSTFEDCETQLDVGSALVIYTDGMIEFERDYLSGMRRFESAAHDVYRNPMISEPARAIRDRVFSGARPTDDAALLFIGVTHVGGPLFTTKRTWTIDARDPMTTRRVKRAIMWQLAGLSADESEHIAVELAYGELVANAAMHTPGPAVVTLEARDDCAVLTFEGPGEPFSINGAHQPELYSEGGRGFWLISQVATSTVVQREGDCNRITVEIPLSVGVE